jgi:hypothetical protein
MELTIGPVVEVTAVVSRPAAIGIDNDPKDPWYVQLYWPFVKASDPNSELSVAPQREPSLE